MSAGTSVLKRAVIHLLDSRQLSIGDAMDRHFAPTFKQRTNGRWDDRGAFMDRISAMRDTVHQVTITVLDELIDGTCYAERHVIDLIGRDGKHTVQEVYVFAERDHDGRFVRIEEATVTMEC